MATKRPGAALGSDKKKQLKQGNLFSFFTKKEKDATPPANASVASTSQCSSSAATAKTPAVKHAAPKLKPVNPDWDKVKIGSRVSVYWPDDDTFYNATVTKMQADKSKFHLEYDDGQCEFVDLRTERFKLLEHSSDKKRKQSKSAPTAKRLFEETKPDKMDIDDDNDDEEEAEFDDEASVASEESAYVHASNDEEQGDDEEDVDDKWMVSDDDDEPNDTTKKRIKKAVKVTLHKTSSKDSRATPSTTKTSYSKKNNSPLQTPMRVTQSNSATKNSFARLKSGSKSADSSSASATKVTVTPNNRNVTPSPPARIAAVAGNGGPIPFVRGVVNPAGSHLHNHLKFLQTPRDSQGRTRDHPDYDPRTLRVDFNELSSHNDNKPVTAAVKQWWDLKSQYYDTVLLFKTGKFYELFHMDSDVGCNVLGLTYMKGHIAHSGFPEISYGPMADRLVRAGLKVARVEQTETPEMLSQRKKTFKRGKEAPKVVNREVCSVMTLGTRTFCYLDDANGLLDDAHGGGGAVGPLLSIREVLVDPDAEESSSSEEDCAKPVCEFGITLVDAVRATVTIGQFADDVLRSRMNTLLTVFAPCEILVEGGKDGASPQLLSLLRSAGSNGGTPRVEKINRVENFPSSTAVDLEIRKKLQRRTASVQPWDIDETLAELHRRGYYPRGSRQENTASTSRWPSVLRAAVEGNADLAISSFGAALFYLQRNLIDDEILSMNIVKAYIPPPSPCAQDNATNNNFNVSQSSQTEASLTEGSNESECVSTKGDHALNSISMITQDVETTDHMALDGKTLQNLEILATAQDHKVAGSLWSKINYTKTPHGSRLLRAWLLRPLYRKVDIDRRADAVEELVSGAAAVAATEASNLLSKCGDIERLLSRVHSLSGKMLPESGSDESARHHPNDRAVLYENSSYTKRKVGDFSKLLNSLRLATQIPELFAGIEIKSPLLLKIVRTTTDGGCFPDMSSELDWFFDNFDCELAAKGLFEPSKGIDPAFDDACDSIDQIQADLEEYQNEMISMLTPRSVAKSSWKYINTKPDSKDKYLIELSAGVKVPDDFILKGKRGSGAKQINKYRTSYVEELVQKLEHAISIQNEGKARGMELVFARFDAVRSLWATAAQTTALLDALNSLARTASKSGYTRPKIATCGPLDNPYIRVIQGRHPCVESTSTCNEFVPNDLRLGGDLNGSEKSSPRALLLSGPNMGGKSTLLRQTCLITVLAQIGSFVPAAECELTPIDRIYTRLGASDKILLGQSTFFVELAETAAALRGATLRSLVIMDELGRGTSTFDGTAIAHGAVHHLVTTSKCLSLFATHYHSLLDEWGSDANVQLGHMECLVASGSEAEASHDAEPNRDRITFLYTLGKGVCPKSFGINVARLANLPEEILVKANKISSEFESRTNTTVTKANLQRNIIEAVEAGDWESLQRLWHGLQV